MTDFFSDITSKIAEMGSSVLDSVKDFFFGTIYGYILDFGDFAFGFFTPDSINDFNFSSLLLFAFGIAVIGAFVKFISIFK